MIWAALIPAWLKRAAGWAVAGLVAVACVWGLAKRDARRGAKLDAARDNIKTRERMDDATRDLPDDTDQLRDWLRKRGAKR